MQRGLLLNNIYACACLLWGSVVCVSMSLPLQVAGDGPARTFLQPSKLVRHPDLIDQCLVVAHARWLMICIGLFLIWISTPELSLIDGRTMFLWNEGDLSQMKAQGFLTKVLECRCKHQPQISQPSSKTIRVCF